MDDALFVRCDERARELKQNARGALPRQRAPAEDLGERRSDEAVHDEERQPELAVAPEVGDGHDVLVPQEARNLRLPEKARIVSGLSREVGAKDLDGDRLAERVVMPSEHERGAACAEVLGRVVSAPDHERRRHHRTVAEAERPIADGQTAGGARGVRQRAHRSSDAGSTRHPLVSRRCH